MTERQTASSDVITVIVVQCRSTNMLILLLVKFNYNAEGNQSYQLAFNMPRPSFVLWILRGEMDVCKLDNDLETSMGIVFPEVYWWFRGLRIRRTEKSNVGLHKFAVSAFSSVNNLIIFDTIVSMPGHLQRSKCHVPQWNCTGNQSLN